MEETILVDILKQTPIAMLLGYFLKIVWDKLVKTQDQKDQMAEGLIKITQLWEDRYSKESTDEREIKEFMKEIREYVKELKDAK